MAPSDDGSPKLVEASATAFEVTPASPGAVTGSATLSTFDDRRARKGKRRKGFEGLPAGELDVVTPPSPDEGVRVIPAPTGPADDVEDAEASTADEAVDSLLDTDALDEVAVDEVAVDEVAADEVAAAEVVVIEEVAAGDEADEAIASSADDVFARLRAESSPVPASEDEVAVDDVEAVAEAVAVAVTEEADGVARTDVAAVSAFTARAGVVGPLEKDLSRALKRALADEQNEVLDLLRRSKPKSVDDVLPNPEKHVARWAEAAAEALADAAAAGAASQEGSSTSVTDLATELAASLTVPLRERIDRGFAASDGNLDDIADRVRALYREWRGQRLNDATSHYTAAAYARGVFDAIDAGTKVCWVIDPSAGACPDCDDNVLAGAVVKGEEFPTGDLAAPAHPGCHCLVLASPI